jgi:hypothetical protein
VGVANRVDWRNLPPISEEEQALIEIPKRPSQTLLKHHDRCDRAAYLYLRYRAGAGSHELDRGAAVHDVIADLIQRFVIEGGESSIPPEEGKKELRRYLAAHPELQMSAVERDAARYMVRNFCLGSWFDPAGVLGVERTVSMELGGFEIVGRVDLIEELGIRMIQITDWKTSFDDDFNMPDSDEWKAESFDDEGNPRYAGNFQTQLYAVLCAFGTFDDGQPLGDSYELFRLRLSFPRYLRTEGLAYKEVTVSRKQLADFRDDVEDQLVRLRDVNGTERRWQPTPGTHCRECPAEYDCPLPRILRPESQHAELDSIEDLERAAASQFFMARRAKNLKARIKKAIPRVAKAQGREAITLPDGRQGVYAGREHALVFIFEDGEVRTSKNHELQLDVERAERYGESVDWGKHWKYRQGTKFDLRKVPPRNGKRASNGR